jgi:hypothetical protein
MFDPFRSDDDAAVVTCRRVADVDAITGTII